MKNHYFFAIKQSFLRLNPWSLRHNLVILATYISAVVSTVFCFYSPQADLGFEIQISIWLWLTVLFANFAEALAEGRGKAHAESLRRNSESAVVHKKMGDVEVKLSALELKKGDLIVCRAGDMIPVDGEVVEGIASVDESAITGESAPVIRESGGDRSAVTGGTTVLSDEIVISVTAESGQGFMDRMISLIESAVRQKTPNEKALDVLLFALTLLFILVVISLPAFVGFTQHAVYSGLSVPVLLALFVCLIPTTIGGLLSAVGIAGMDRLIRKNVVAKNGRAVEAAGDITVLLLDKTGTITLGNRLAVAFHPVEGVSMDELIQAAYTSSLSDETPEGRSIITLAKKLVGLKPLEQPFVDPVFIPFSAKTRMSGVDSVDKNGRVFSIRKGATDAVQKWVQTPLSKKALDVTHRIASGGGTPLAVASNQKILGIIELKDIVKSGINERFLQLRKMGIKTVMITGDNPATAAAIAAEAGVDDFIAQATPEDKLNRIKSEQAQGYLVAMTGDGTNDAPALAQADVGVAMNLGTQAARDAGNMVDLDSNPTKLIEIVETGKQLLMTRGALTTFSIANDVAKYFAILPALFVSIYALQPGKTGPLSVLNIMRLASSHSAILSAVIFNALIVIALIPLALRGVTYKPQEASSLLVKNLLIYGAGGIVIPFIGIKLIDVVITVLNLV